MAGGYEILSSETTVELLGATDVQDVFQVTARAQPSGVVFNVRFPPIIDNPQSIRDILGEWAGWYNDLAALPHVAGLVNLQDIDAAGQINDVTQVTVRSTSGKTNYTITVPGEDIGSPKAGDDVAAAVANLDALEGR